jgi:hypothetical protein
MLAQQASDFDIVGCKFHMKEKLMKENSLVLCTGATELTQSTPRVGLAELQGWLSHGRT